MDEDDYESLPNSTVAINMFAGAVAGITEHSVMYPLDSVKTRMQVFSSNLSSMTLISKISTSEGLSVLWRGLNSVIVGAGPAHALSFATFEKCKLLFRNPLENGHQIGADALSGACATIVHDGIMTPFDVVKQRMQISGNNFYRGILDCTIATFKAEGLKAFYISYPTTILMSIPFQSIHFASYEALKKTLNPVGTYDPKTHIISGGLAGGIASLITQPMDVIKTLLQTRGLSTDSQIKSLHGFREGCGMIYDRYGWKGFYRGWIPRVLTHMPSTAICWTTYEFMKMWFNIKVSQVLLSAMESLNSLLASGKYHDLLAIVKGFRNGAVYGCKIRFPHALVMTLLFKRRTLQETIRSVLDLTFQHAKNLASFVTIYKSLLYCQKVIKGKEDSIDSFIAGAIGGYFIFGNDTPVNHQIVLYLLSRIMIGLGSLMVKKGLVKQPSNGFTIMATLVWGIVMWLFRNDKDTLQGSLVSSMEYLYNDSDKFDNFKNWLWHNK